MKKSLKIISMLLAIVMLLAVCPLATLAEAIAKIPSAIPYEAGNIPIDNKNFPSNGFRQYVHNNCDMNGDGHLSESEIERVNSIYLFESMGTLKGIEYFTALEMLTCQYCELTSLDLSKNTRLTALVCSANLLTSLDVSNCPLLTQLECAGNQLTSLDLSNNTELIQLNCEDNRLTSLDLSNNTSLSWLTCGRNQLTSLEVNSTNFGHVDCQNNQLTSLDFSGSASLTELYCYDNQLTSLNLSGTGSLTMLYCYKNRLSSLDLSQSPLLTKLDCSINNIKMLDLSGNLFLTELDCSHNELLALDLTGVTLNELNCKNNCYKIEADPIARTFAVTDLPIQLDLMRVSDFQGCDFENDIITVRNPYSNAHYKFDCGNGTMLEVTLATDLATTGSPEIDYASFPDSRFRSYVLEEIDTDENCILSSDEISKVEKIEAEESNIYSLMGVEYFTALNTLFVNQNQLTRLDLSKNTALISLHCNHNELMELDVTANTGLFDLTCGFNRLTQLDLSNNIGLGSLFCMNNMLTELDLSKNARLVDINCNDNPLTELDLSNNEVLRSLYCSNCQLSDLDLTNNSNLEMLNCDNNNLTELDVSAATILSNLYCGRNNLTSLDLSKNEMLSFVDCNGNSLTVTLPYGENTFDLSTLPGFDVSKASDFSGGTVEGNILTLNEGASKVNYLYDCGNNFSNMFILDFEYAEAEAHEVTFVDGATNEIIDTVTVEHGGDVTFPTAPTHEGYAFTGWDSDGKNITADTTITAQYTINTYTVTFVDGVTNEIIDTVTVEHGGDVTLPTAPTHEGYAFTGWDGDGKNITADTTITAQYKINTYTVTFVDGFTNQEIAKVTVEHGSDATFPTAPTHQGYTFTGWDNDGKNITENVTITAQYELNTYTVTFVNGATNEVISTVTVAHGGDVELPNVPENEGYTFTGWDRDGKNITADTTITAQYKINTYTVTFVDGKTNEVISTVMVEHGKNVEEFPTPPEHIGFVFTGWDGDGKNITADITLTAQYELSYIPGDVNLDGEVNTGDAVMILKFAATMVEFNDVQMSAADVTLDGEVNTGDAVKILKFAAGMIELPTL